MAAAPGGCLQHCKDDGLPELVELLPLDELVELLPLDELVELLVLDELVELELPYMQRHAQLGAWAHALGIGSQ